MAAKGGKSAKIENKVDEAIDIDGREIHKGDVVATITGNLTAKICDIAEDFGTLFVCLRAVQHPFSKGVWHAADQVQLIKPAKPAPEQS